MYGWLLVLACGILGLHFAFGVSSNFSALEIRLASGADTYGFAVERLEVRSDFIPKVIHWNGSLQARLGLPLFFGTAAGLSLDALNGLTLRLDSSRTKVRVFLDLFGGLKMIPPAFQNPASLALVAAPTFRLRVGPFAFALQEAVSFFSDGLWFDTLFRSEVSLTPHLLLGLGLSWNHAAIYRGVYTDGLGAELIVGFRLGQQENRHGAR